MTCNHKGPMRLLEDEDGNRGIQCPGCGMYAFNRGRHRQGRIRTFVAAFKYAIGHREELPPGVRAVGWESSQS